MRIIKRAQKRLQRAYFIDIRQGVVSVLQAKSHRKASGKEFVIDMNVSGIYQIRNIVNGKVYVGSSVNLRKRKNGHLSTLRNNKHSSTHLQRAFNRYGEDAFVFEVLEICDVDEIEERETYWILTKSANNHDFGYNSRFYVESNLGFRHTEESKRKISINRRGKGTGSRELSDETREFLRQKCIEQDLRQYHTEETEERRLENLRKAIVGKPLSDEHKASISDHNKGSKNGFAKLTEEKVKVIKKLLEEENLTQEKIAEKFGVSKRTIGFIKSGKRWGHVKVV